MLDWLPDFILSGLVCGFLLAGLCWVLWFIGLWFGWFTLVISAWCWMLVVNDWFVWFVLLLVVFVGLVFGFGDCVLFIADWFVSLVGSGGCLRLIIVYAWFVGLPAEVVGVCYLRLLGMGVWWR